MQPSPFGPQAAGAGSHPTAARLIDTVLDAGSFGSWDRPVRRPAGIEAPYADELAAAQRGAGTDEAVITGAGTIHGHRVAVLASEFRFLAGSIGIAAADRIVAAIRRATRERLPLLAAPASGGTRMHEGTAAFVQMVRITQAIADHKRAGLPYLVYLRHPTTGGVFASWGSLGHVTVGEPGALVGFLGPKVYRALYHRPFPPGVQTSENLAAHGLIDAVLPPDRLPEIAARALAVLTAARDAAPTTTAAGETDQPDVDPWTSILITRDPHRPGVRELLRFAATDVVPLSGTGEGERGLPETSLQVVLARFSGVPCVLLGQDRASQAGQGPLGPAALRVARRGMRLAADLDLPLVSVIDTPGAALSREAEEGGLAGEIARCLSDLVGLPAATVCVLLGEGSGGGAMALLPADRVIAARHAWLSPLPPEGASAIMYHGDVGRAPEIAAAQRVRATDLRRIGIVDRIVAEHDDASREPAAFSRRLGAVLAEEVSRLVARPAPGPAERSAQRSGRYAFGT